MSAYGKNRMYKYSTICYLIQYEPVNEIKIDIDKVWLWAVSMLDVVKLESNSGNGRCLADVRNEEGRASLSDGAIGGISIEVGEDVTTDISSCFVLCSNIDVVNVDGWGGASGGLRRSYYQVDRYADWYLL